MWFYPIRPILGYWEATSLVTELVFAGDLSRIGNNNLLNLLPKNQNQNFSIGHGRRNKFNKIKFINKQILRLDFSLENNINFIL